MNTIKQTNCAIFESFCSSAAAYIGEIISNASKKMEDTQ